MTNFFDEGLVKDRPGVPGLLLQEVLQDFG